MTVVDLGPVNWAFIWRDRASLVTAEHLTILNAIPTSEHLKHPGYWRNVFAGFEEVRANASNIARIYTPEGKAPSFHEVPPQPPSLALPESPKSEKINKLLDQGYPPAVAQPIADLQQNVEDAKKKAGELGQQILTVGIIVLGAYVYSLVK